MGKFGVANPNPTAEEIAAITLPSYEQMLATLSPDARKFLEVLPEAVASRGHKKAGVRISAMTRDPLGPENVADMWAFENRGNPAAEEHIRSLQRSGGAFGTPFSSFELFAIVVTLGVGAEFVVALEAATAGTAVAPAAGGGAAGGGVPAVEALGGGAAAGGGGAAGGGAAAGGGFFSNPWVNLGINLGTGYLDQQAQKDANQANQRAADARIAQALAALSPEEIARLTQQFIPEIAAITNPQFQAQQQALQTAGARAGFTGNQADTNLQQTLQAGLRGQQINANSQLAFQQALGLGGQRASAITGVPIPPIQNVGSFGKPIQDSFNQFLKQQTTLEQQQQQQSPGAPFKFPGQR